MKLSIKNIEREILPILLANLSKIKIIQEYECNLKENNGSHLGNVLSKTKNNR